MSNLITQSKFYAHAEDCGCGEHSNITTNKALQYDPTRTITLRKQFSADMYNRFRLLKGMVNELVNKMDVFGLRPQPQVGLFDNALAPKAFLFKTDAEKVNDFMGWLNEMEDKHILEVTARNGRRVVARNEWENIYIGSAYKKGIERGYTELNKVGVQIEGALGSSFFAPIHAEAVGLLYTRVFKELQGVTEAMDQQISRTLAQGLAEGLGPYDIAKDINKVVDNIGIVRARTIARTEIVRAHHMATINVYKSAGILDIKILAEWDTAKDAKVCFLCAPLEGTIWPLVQAEGMIPRHPNCRCVALPYIPDTKEFKDDKGKTPNLKKAVAKSVGRENNSTWAGGAAVLTNEIISGEIKKGNLLATLTDGTTVNFGKLHIPSGPKGEIGPRGVQGRPGKD